jgi:small-conductance mechanosensitive channel
VKRIVLIAQLCLALLLAGMVTASGQESSGAAADKYAPLVEQAKKDGATVIIITPGEQEAEAAAPPAAGMTSTGVKLREEIRRLIVTSPDMPRRVASALEIISPDGSLGWLAIAVVTALAALLIGSIPRRLIGIWGREYFRYMWNPNPRDDAERIGYLLFRAALQTLYTVLLFGVAMLVAIVFDWGHEASRSTIFVIVVGFCAWRILREVIAFNLLAPDVPSHRMLNIPDRDAKAIFADFQWVFAIAITVISLSAWITSLDLDGDANKLLLILASFIAAGLIGYLTVKHRRAGASAILGAGAPETKPLWRRLIANSWHMIGLIYLAVATVVSVVRLLLGLPSANVLISAPAIALIAAIGAYGVLYLIIEWLYRSRRAAFERKLAAARHLELERQKAEESARREAEKSGLPEGEQAIGNVAAVQHPTLPPFRPIFRPLAQQAAALLVAFVAIAFVLEAWNIRTAGGNSFVAAIMNTIAILFVAWLAYRAVAVFIDEKLKEEGDFHPVDPTLIEDEPSAHGATRLGTLLPLVRNVLLTVIVAVTAMIVLSNVGVDVAPLFAGAGVVGLAVGFGAQALIRDIFSGGFFLFDDAFRKGEYVELGDVRGTVEKISLRSFQLRHHNGPLHTIPFGEIKQLTNYSRDWVIMKLPLRLTFDADIEKVRKLVKKLGVELLQHPEVGKNFLQPLKSQGVVEIDDSAMVVRVKFMTRPDDQWTTRKVVYASIQDLFRREGIRFADRSVTVRIAEDNETTPQARKKAVAAAAEHAVAGRTRKRSAAADDR